jgi:hypothetical protein
MLYAWGCYRGVRFKKNAMGQTPIIVITANTQGVDAATLGAERASGLQEYLRQSLVSASMQTRRLSSLETGIKRYFRHVPQKQETTVFFSQEKNHGCFACFFVSLLSIRVLDRQQLLPRWWGWC